MNILGIETSCDDSAAAIVRDGKVILSSQVASQTELHAPFGGVVPELASRRHVEILPLLVDKAIEESHLSLDAIDAIAVTYGPGLIGSLLVGLNYAKGLSFHIKKPLVGVNHVEAHLYAALMSHETIAFPAIGLVVSGGHTSLYFMEAPFSYKLIGQTFDDALGEAFDKAAILLGLSYPGGAEIERVAKGGDKHRFMLKVGQIKNRPFDFSFSGIKTGVLNLVQKLSPLDDTLRSDIAASFQHVCCRDVLQKCLLAAKEYSARSIIVGGGVGQNQYLREIFAQHSSAIPTFFAPKNLCMDNGAMIAALGYHHVLRGGSVHPCELEAESRLSL